MNNYSVIEKILHNSAFKSWSSLTSLSEIESGIFKKELTDIEVKKPVFITALPRAGTTLLLELCVETKEFVSHTYRDMPFLLVPLFWSRFSKLFRNSDAFQERAHGDGMMINVDSPEAFGEIIWKGFWPSRYKKDRIVPWATPDYADFEKFFQDHLCKILFLRRDPDASQTRYVSKNNLNIARIEYLKRVFPDAIIVVPFRDPMQHASSLLRQHRNFLKIHEEDAFTQKYMEDIGHYDFGQNLRPVDFDNWLSSEQVPNPDTLSFWLQYWISTYRYLLESTSASVKFFAYDAFCHDPEKHLKQLGEILEINDVASFLKNADRVSPPKSYDVNTDGIAPEILEQAETLYKDLQKAALS